MEMWTIKTHYIYSERGGMYYLPHCGNVTNKDLVQNVSIF